jgi:hypothetical protein
MEEIVSIIYEHGNEPLGPDDIDGMAQEIADAEADGWEGEHVFDASIEDPPHPFWKDVISSSD